MTKASNQQSPKHPRHMTTEEAVSHLFHPKVVEHIKKEKDAPKKRIQKKNS
jgi:hypothetical protein